MQTNDVEISGIDSRELSAIAFAILAAKLAKLMDESQRAIQDAALIEAYTLFRVSSPESLECFLSINFPIIKEERTHES